MSITSLDFKIIGTATQDNAASVRFRFGSYEYWIELKRHSKSGDKIISLYKDRGDQGYILIGARIAVPIKTLRADVWLRYLIRKIKQFCKTGYF